MKIRISSKTLTDELFKLQGVVSHRSTLAILSNALLVAEGNTLTLHATDLDISVSTSCECEVLEPGKVTLQARSLFDIVKNLEEDTLSLETEENHWAKLKSGNVNCRIVGTHADEFPHLLDIAGVELFPIGTRRLLDMIEKTLFSVSTDDARANLTGAFFKVTNEKTLLMVSTDGHRLSKIETKPEEFDAGGDIPSALNKGIIIPRKGLAEIKRTVDAKSDELSFGIIDNNIVFKSGPMSLSVRLIEGSFPDFTQVLPKESEHRAIVEKDVFQQALKFVSLFASSKTNNVRISLSDDGLELYASDPDRGEATKVVPMQYSGQAVKAGFNYRYLNDVVSALDGSEVSIEIIDTLSPTLIRDTQRDEMLFVVMPMRL
ncbi:DNA polymerase III subunit beta [Lujinxingia vulgaris]|uniref:Beta sliding clamp n=1 Tax=Lujinxingia vulgaris TaxID=2600176 RepID=A0A5C6XHT2_9DELT|nr:DNA polymerase III subunit beta [Lujinxingia vulgaris]TXD41616.1 DNA polymerase III subunit beta [Lujinxingia vulgaris]